MTEPQFSLAAEADSLQPGKPVKKRSASASNRRKSVDTPESIPPDTAPEAVAGVPAKVPGKRTKKNPGGGTDTQDTAESLENPPKKRASRKSAPQRNADEKPTVSAVKEEHPGDANAESRRKQPAERGRRKTTRVLNESQLHAESSAGSPQQGGGSDQRPGTGSGGPPRPQERPPQSGAHSHETSARIPWEKRNPELLGNSAPPHAADTGGESVDRARKPYPVYVPRHIAKQMEQEGLPAPLAVDADAQQAEFIRAAALENRHAVSPQPAALQTSSPSETPDHGEAQSSERTGQTQPMPHRQDREFERGPRNEHNLRNSQRGPGRERGRGGRKNDRNRNRDDHRRNERRDYAPDSATHETHREHQRDLPPPTPEELSPGSGIIEISGKGFGFLRDPLRGYAQHPSDIFVSPEMVRRFNLRDGQLIDGIVRRSGRGQQMHEITTVNGDPPEESKHQSPFDELTVINPCEPLHMATVPERYTTRIIDMLTPIGKGQRGLIVAQPRTGKTTFLQHIADAMVKNHPDVKLIILLVDERPEEVTEIRHTVPGAEIMASSNDMDVRSHTRIAELAIERAKRLVEAGKDVFILLDSITRLGRAFNNALTNGGRTMSGGLDARALETPRKLFAAARNTEEAGSLTIVATALIDTGSRMDEIIFQEFKGTGNMELVLDRKIAESRIYPAVDIFQSGTRREELLVPADLLQKIHFLRRGLSGARPMDAIDRLLSFMRKFQTNEQMLREIRG
jgi:transcription termination factor Rho